MYLAGYVGGMTTAVGSSSPDWAPTKEYESNKWKVIGQKVGKPAKACEQYAKEHFPDLGAKNTR
ncbi:hypothetical protein BN1723_012282 [Verticillium longisporum]|uniref:Uncharacterized protein n=1 Tax=Verticillium longisporum TaxID=100787 RepID=A0A0G4LGK9_VERLO|nr:hypothetical protein BN1723_012282 [Verticillium longisporum]